METLSELLLIFVMENFVYIYLGLGIFTSIYCSPYFFFCFTVCFIIIVKLHLLDKIKIMTLCFEVKYIFIIFSLLIYPKSLKTNNGFISL